MSGAERTPRTTAVDSEWPRDFGRDGISGLVSPDRAMRARDVSRPRPVDLEDAAAVIDRLISRAAGRR